MFAIAKKPLPHGNSTEYSALKSGNDSHDVFQAKIDPFDNFRHDPITNIDRQTERPDSVPTHIPPIRRWQAISLKALL